MKMASLLVVLLMSVGMASVAVAQTPAVTHNTWSSGVAMPVALRWPMTGVIKGQIYVVGGVTDTGVVANNQIYNPVTNIWSTGAAIPVATMDGGSAVVKNILYVFGGTPDGSTWLNTVWAYSPKTNTWTSKAAMPTARASVGLAVEKDIIYVVGGYNGDRLNTVESYNPATDAWTEEAPLLAGKSNLTVGLVGATIVAADGYTASGDTGDNEGYDATTNVWTQLAPDPSPRDSACGGSIGPQFYVAGGVNLDVGNTALNVTESFKLSKNKWTTQASMPQAVTEPGSAVYKGRLYCIGGGSADVPDGIVFNYVQIYQP